MGPAIGVRKHGTNNYTLPNNVAINSLQISAERTAQKWEIKGMIYAPRSFRFTRTRILTVFVERPGFLFLNVLETQALTSVQSRDGEESEGCSGADGPCPYHILSCGNPESNDCSAAKCLLPWCPDRSVSRDCVYDVLSTSPDRVKGGAGHLL